jgi:hypothetical protein
MEGTHDRDDLLKRSRLDDACDQFAEIQEAGWSPAQIMATLGDPVARIGGGECSSGPAIPRARFRGRWQTYTLLPRRRRGIIAFASNCFGLSLL